MGRVTSSSCSSNGCGVCVVRWGGGSGGAKGFFFSGAATKSNAPLSTRSTSSYDNPPIFHMWTHRPLRHRRALERLHRRPGVVAVPACVCFCIFSIVCRGQWSGAVGTIELDPHSIQSQGRLQHTNHTGATHPSNKSIHPIPHPLHTPLQPIPTQPNPHTYTSHTYTHTYIHCNAPLLAALGTKPRRGSRRTATAAARAPARLPWANRSDDIPVVRQLWCVGVD